MLKRVPIIGKNRLHPRDIVMYGYAKYPVLFFPFLWIPSIAMIVSCLQKFKVRDGRKILKTDGKLLTLLRCRVFKMKITWDICCYILLMHSRFLDWADIAETYFRTDEHPTVKIMDLLRKKYARRFRWGWE